MNGQESPAIREWTPSSDSAALHQVNQDQDPEPKFKNAATDGGIEVSQILKVKRASLYSPAQHTLHGDGNLASAQVWSHHRSTIIGCAIDSVVSH
jgi:hypothetical protein